MGSEQAERIVVDARLRERGYGSVEGKSLQELRAAAKAAGFTEKNYSSFIPPGAESLDQVRHRIQEFCKGQLVRQALPDQNVLLVTHGGVIREFMRFFRDLASCNLTGLHEPLRVTPNTGVNCFRVFYSPSAQSDGRLHQTMTKVECLTVHQTDHLQPSPSDHPPEPLSPDPASVSLAMSEVAPPLEAL